MNDDLIGKPYSNGEDGLHYRVTTVIDETFVGAVQVSSDRPVTAIANFVRSFLKE